MKSREEIDYINNMYAKNHLSIKKCTNCKYYIEDYKDDFTLKYYGYGDIKIRPACTLSGNYSCVSHNPAACCNDYQTKTEIK